MIACLTFTPDGVVQGLYTEAIELRQLGTMRITRATRIEFNNQHQVWRVRDTGGFPMFTAPTRQQCLEWEQQYFNNQ